MKLSVFLQDVYDGNKVNIRKRYLNDNTLRKYVELCYSDGERPRESLPDDYNQDTAPIDHLPSNLEKSFRRVSRAMLDVELPEGKAQRMLYQIRESISAPENKFLEEVFDGHISFLPEKLAMKYDNGELE